MKKWIVSIILLVVVALVSAISIYWNSVKPVKQYEEEAVKIAKEETSLTSVSEFTVYNGEESYYVVQGKNNQGEKLIVWVADQSKKATVLKASDGITRKQAINKLLEEKTPKEIVSVKLGMENNIPLWEIYYTTENHSLNYYYVDFKTGEWLKKIENI